MPRPSPGLTRDKRNRTWIIDKVIDGRRFHRGTGTTVLSEAEKDLAELIKTWSPDAFEEHSFRDAVVNYVLSTDKPSLTSEVAHLQYVYPYLAELPLSHVRKCQLEPFIRSKREEGIKARTINNYIDIVIRVLRKAADEWIDETGKPWLTHLPRIARERRTDDRIPYPISWAEQDFLMSFLPDHLQDAGLFMINSGAREHDVCALQWEWEHYLPGTDITFFIIPGDKHKNRLPRLLIPNSIGREIINRLRRNEAHAVFVFTYEGQPLSRLYNTAWQNARQKATERYQQTFGRAAPVGFVNLRIHDFKHTCGRRLRGAKVDEKDRQDLLGHKSGDVTALYSEAEIYHLAMEIEKITTRDRFGSPALSQVIQLPKVINQ